MLCNVRLNTEPSQVVQAILAHGGPETILMTCLLKLFSADATVAGAERSILKLTMKLGNILSNFYSANAFDSPKAPNCFLPILAL